MADAEFDNGTIMFVWLQYPSVPVLKSQSTFLMLPLSHVEVDAIRESERTVHPVRDLSGGKNESRGVF
jgi:hypothetical protein